MVVGKDELTFVPADCGGYIILNCTALQNSVNYTSVTWYKVSHVHAYFHIYNMLSQKSGDADLMNVHAL